MNILLTGGTGYLGSHLLRALVRMPEQKLTIATRQGSHLERIHELLDIVECVRIDQCNFLDLIEGREIGAIVHCATDYGRKRTPLSDIVEANLVLPLRLLDAAVRSRHPVSFINTDTMLDKSISAYSMSKKQFRDWLGVYAVNSVCINVAIEHFFGPGDDPSKFATFVVQALLRNDACIDLTLGNQTRDFIHIDDVVNAFLHILRFASTSPPGFSEFQIGRGDPVTVRSFVELSKRLCGNTSTRLAFGALPYRPNEVMNVDVDISKLRQLGWAPQLDLEQGLSQMIERERKWLEDSSSLVAVDSSVAIFPRD